MRLKRGTLAGEKRDGRWVVYLDATEQPTERDQTSVQAPTEQPTKQATQHDYTAIVSAKDETIQAQREEIAFLRDQLEQQRRDQAAERERFDVIHREALTRIEALTAGVVNGDQVDVDVGPAPEPPQTRHEAPGREEAPDSGADAVAPRSWFGDVLARWRGR